MREQTGITVVGAGMIVVVGVIVILLSKAIGDRNQQGPGVERVGVIDDDSRITI